MADSRSGRIVAHFFQQSRYEISVDGEPAGLAAYVDRGNQRIFYHTEVDDRFAGQGLAGELVSNALDEARSSGKRIVPVCPFVAKYVKTHHEYDAALDPVTRDALAAVKAVADGQEQKT